MLVDETQPPPSFQIREKENKKYNQTLPGVRISATDVAAKKLRIIRNKKRNVLIAEKSRAALSKYSTL